MTNEQVSLKSHLGFPSIQLTPLQPYNATEPLPRTVSAFVCPQRPTNSEFVLKVCLAITTYLKIKEKLKYGKEKIIYYCSKYIIFYMYILLTAKSLQSCLTLCDPIDGSPPGSPVPGSLQARTLEWVAISFSNA